MTVGEMKKRLEGMDEDANVAVGIPVQGGIQPLPVGDMVDATDQGGNKWLLCVPASPCGGHGCDDCDSGGCDIGDGDGD